MEYNNRNYIECKNTKEKFFIGDKIEIITDSCEIGGVISYITSKGLYLAETGARRDKHFNFTDIKEIKRIK